MNFLGIQRRRRAPAQSVGVKGIAIRQFPDAVIRRRLGQNGIAVIDQLAIGEINVARDRGLDSLLERDPLFVTQTFDLRGARLERRRQNIFRGRLRDEVVHFGENFLHHETRRQDPFLFAHFQALDQLVELRSDRHEALPVILAVPRREEPMRVCHERGEFALDAEELVYRIIVPLEFFPLDLLGQVPFENVSGERLRRVLFLQRIGAQVRQIFFRAIEKALLMRGRSVAEFRAVAGKPEAFDQADGREQLGLVE